MKKIFLLSLLLVIVHLSFTIEDCSSQDYLLSVGRAYLRYDADSNRVRLGGPGTIKFAREYNVAPFEFNASHFNWSTSSGLNLNDVASHDSSWFYKMSVVKDTGDGEISPYKTRHYTLKKPSWANGNTPFDMLWIYRSFTSGSLVASDSAYAVNNSDLLYFGTNVVVSGGWGTVYELVLPCQGQFIVFINYDYEFRTASTAPEEPLTNDISVRVLRFPSTVLDISTVSYTYPPSSTAYMNRGRGSLVVVVETYGPDESLYVQAALTANADAAAIIRSITVNYLLVR